MDPCMSLPLTEDALFEAETKLKEWAAVHGIVLRTSEADPIYRLELAPITLLPSPFPAAAFEKVKKIQKSFNELMHKVAHDPDFLKATLHNTVAGDEFTAKLFRIYEAVLETSISQGTSLGLIRCDYLLDVSRGQDAVAIKQVEINTISVSFAALATEVAQMHRYIASEIGLKGEIEKIPSSPSVTGMASGLIAAWKTYNSPSSAIVFAVEPFVRMIGDQKLIEFAIKQKCPDIAVLRRTLRDFGEKGKVVDQKLYIDDIEVAVVYFRDGYMPHQYPLDIDWEARLLVETSLAIKCPSIQYQLAGTKKVQQELANPETLRRFVKDEETITAMMEVFTGLYTLDEGEEGDSTVAMAKEHPEKYVLKPQREGGGNNLYGEDVREVLQACKNAHERSSYILMDRIVSPITKNYIIRPGHRASLTEVVSELGIYGVILGTPSDIIMNEEIGHLLRSKPSDEDEGGVVAGYSALDSMYMI